MSAKHANISIFVSHMGCPNQCSFCNQRYIAGTADVPNADSVKRAVEESGIGEKFSFENAEIAFFGGSFTAIDRSLMIELLEAAHGYVLNGRVRGIRVSTRPDAIDSEVLSILKKYGVTAIELGAQSMDDEVLLFNKRGHTAEDVRKASRLIKQNGFELGLQMMTGLPKSDNAKDIKTADEFIKLKPDTVRIYPTIVLENTDLCGLVKRGEYSPQSLDKAVLLCARLLCMFKSENIKVIRLGLHTISEEHYVAGPWHPAFSEMVYSEIYFNNARKTFAKMPSGEYNVYVPVGDISKMIGQKRNNILMLEKMGYICKVKEDKRLKEFEIYIERK